MDLNLPVLKPTNNFNTTPTSSVIHHGRYPSAAIYVYTGGEFNVEL